MIFALEIPRQNILRGTKFEDAFRNQYKPMNRKNSQYRLAVLGVQSPFGHYLFHVIMAKNSKQNMAYIVLLSNRHYYRKLNLDGNLELSALQWLRQHNFTLRDGKTVVIQENAFNEYNALLTQIQGMGKTNNFFIRINFEP